MKACTYKYFTNTFMIRRITTKTFVSMHITFLYIQPKLSNSNPYINM